MRRELSRFQEQFQRTIVEDPIVSQCWAVNSQGDCTELEMYQLMVISLSRSKALVLDTLQRVASQTPSSVLKSVLDDLK